MEALQNPLAILKREADSIRDVIKSLDNDVAEIQKQITALSIQRSSLVLVAQAIDNEMDRIRTANPIVEQLEFELDPE
jgi:predicted  nucleic acid-binding Zn-ribbon protein